MAKLYIPDLFVASYKKQDNTMNGLIAYLTYYKTKNKSTVYKKESWLKWQDKSIPVNEFENKPTKGFYISRDIKRVSYSHFGTSRYEKMRIYDPRGFDFEISIKNLALILFCSDLNKCEISGEFVYAWDGQELVLLPTVSEEYQDAIATTTIQNNKVSTKDLIVGATYQDKKENDFIYLGRHDYYKYPNNEAEVRKLFNNGEFPLYKKATKTSPSNYYESLRFAFYNVNIKKTIHKKEHLFIKKSIVEKYEQKYTDDESFSTYLNKNIKTFFLIGNVSKLSHLVSEKKLKSFPDVYQKIIDSNLCKKISSFKFKKVNVSADEILSHYVHHSETPFFFSLFGDYCCTLNFRLNYFKRKTEQSYDLNFNFYQKNEFNELIKISRLDFYNALKEKDERLKNKQYDVNEILQFIASFFGFKTIKVRSEFTDEDIKDFCQRNKDRFFIQKEVLSKK